MACSSDLIAYLLEQLGGEVEGISARKMFGEYGFYRNGKLCALACDDAFYFKPTKAARALLEARGELVEAPPYTGASLYYLIENIDDTEFLRKLSDVTFKELPVPKPKVKKPKAKGAKAAKEKPISESGDLL